MIREFYNTTILNRRKAADNPAAQKVEPRNVSLMPVIAFLLDFLVFVDWPVRFDL